MSNLAHKHYEDGELTYLPLENIVVKEGFNPRLYFDEKHIADLSESIKQEGVIQPISVRPAADKPGLVWITVGECRYRAAKQAGLTEMPCMIRLIDEASALAMAVVENDKREDISPAEEAKSAQRMLDECKGDKKEVLRLTGWSATKLDSRLLLLHADESVLDALAARQIKMGHAELLATVPAEFQKVALKKIIDNDTPVAELKKQLSAFTQDLGKAMFNIDACTGCEHNSTTQFGLFEQSVGQGRCSNSLCWKDKTAQALANKKDALKDTYNVVWLRSEKDEANYVTLFKSGGQGVGDDQFLACQQCANFGVIIEDAPGKEGRLEEDCCFDTACNKKKVKAYLSDLSGVQTSGTKSPASTAKTSAKAKTAPKKDANTVAATPKRVTEFVDGVIRQTAAVTTKTNAKMTKIVAIYALYEQADYPDIPHIEEYGKYSRDEIYVKLATLEESVLDEMMCELAALAFYANESKTHYKTEVSDALAILHATDQHLSSYFVVTKAFAQTTTKTLLKGMLEETKVQTPSFPQWYNDKQDNEKAFDALFGKKTEDILADVFPDDAPYDFKGFVPNSVTEHIDGMVKKFTTKEKE